MIFGTWNLRRLYRPGSVQKDARELVGYGESSGTSAALNEQTVASFP